MAQEKKNRVLAGCDATYRANKQQDVGEDWEAFAQYNLELVLPDAVAICNTAQNANDTEEDPEDVEDENACSFTIRQQQRFATITKGNIKV